MANTGSPLMETDMNSPPKKSNKSNKRLSVERIYQKKTQLEHILLRPDAYIGSVEPTKQLMWVWDGKNNCMVNREVNFVPGLYKIFDEILVNAADNKHRDPKMNYIKIVIDQEKNLVSVMNNGKGIPVVMHKEEKLFVPSMIFGHLLTSSNYDDTQKKVTGGRNGYGAKLCNIYSTEFCVETVCDRKHFKQTWKKNMSKTQEPKIVDVEKSDFTCVKFHPDLEKFKMTQLDDDTVALMTKRAYDMAGCIRGVAVYLNGNKLPVKSFEDYIQLYLKNASDEDSDDEGEKRKIVYEVVNKRWEVAVTVSHRGFQQASFVNNIATTKGGTHINYVVDQMIEKLIGIIKRKTGKGSAAIKPFQIKNHLWVFVNCLIENPAFDSQTKENMTLRQKAFGSDCVLGEKFVKQVTQCGVVENILDWVKLKTQSQLKKKSGSKNSKLKGIPKLDDANDAGSKNAIDCTLILTEGDSAKTLAVSGLSIVGRDRYGVFPLRGKLLNVREATHKQASEFDINALHIVYLDCVHASCHSITCTSELLENQEINNIVKIMGLQYGKKYLTREDLKTLRYGRLMIMTDQDQDGSHIKGLLINFVHHNWPGLLKLPFLEEFITPIVKVSKGKEEIAFYSIPEFEEWKENVVNEKSWRVKYYKGLGTSTPKEAKEYFADMDKHRIVFDYSGITDDEAISLAFSKKKVAERKVWLTNQLEERKARREAGLPEMYLYGPGTKSISYTDFVNKELILFSNADNERSIPSLLDGLKPGQRKVLFTCFKRNDKREVKVAQLAGSVAELSAYHHGEQSLAMTIVNLAQNFVGSNNLNLLQPIGQFGTRLHGGKDSASSRYIFTKLSPLARLLFPVHDDAVLNFLVEDNQVIEPEWYCPIIPMVLVNGADGIGTGYSTKIPNYDVRQLVKYVRDMLEGVEPAELFPCYKNFTGEINKIADQKYEVRGRIDVDDDKTIDITELPVCTWTQTYKESVLEVMLHGTEKYKSCIADYKEHQTDTTVHFVVTMADGEFAIAKDTGLHKKFSLVSSINTTNMVLFDSYGAIKKYENVNEIIREFYKIRLDLYQKRKDFLEGMLEAEAKRLSNQARFILEKIDGTIVIEDKTKRVVLMKLVERGYDSDPVKVWKDGQKRSHPIIDDGETDDSASETSSTSSTAGPDFSYLLSMALLSLTKEKKDELLKQRDDKIVELRILRQKTPKDLWNVDLDVFIVEFNAVEKQEREEADAQIQCKNKPGGRARSRTTKAASKKTAAKPSKVPSKQAKAPSKQAKAPTKHKEKQVTDEDLGFSENSEDSEMLSLSERLALKKYEDTSDVSSVTSVSSRGKSSGKTSPSTKQPVQVELDDSDDSVVPQSKAPTSTKKTKKAPAKSSKKTAPVNTIVQAFQKQASKRESETIDSDSSSNSVSIVTSKPPAKKAKMSKKPTAIPKRKMAISSSDDEASDDGADKPGILVKRTTRRPKAAVKYIIDDDGTSEESADEKVAKAGENSWVDLDDADDDDEDSDFE